jgi:hypothetical protein
MAESKEDVAQRREILLEEGLTKEQYDAVMRRRCHDAWNNEVITSRDFRTNYFEWIKSIFFLQLIATNVILLVCAVFGYTAPAIVAGALAGITGLIATVTKHMFSTESTKMANDLIRAIDSRQVGGKKVAASSTSRKTPLSSE